MVHLVFSGGSYLGFCEFGSLIMLNPKKIQSVYGTSAGSILCILSILSKYYSWEDIENYLVKRPWFNVFRIMPKQLLSIHKKKGLYDEQLISELLNPLLYGLNLSSKSTLKEFYEYTHIPMYIYTTCLTTFDIVEISYKTFPDLSIEKAVHMSCAIPFLFQPCKFNNNLYVDGGFLYNYPLESCLMRVHSESKDYKNEKIIGFTINKISKKDNELEHDDSMINYITTIMNGIHNKISKPINYEHYDTSILEEIIIHIDDSILNIHNATQSCCDDPKVRKMLVEKGKQTYNEVFKNSTKCS